MICIWLAKSNVDYHATKRSLQINGLSRHFPNTLSKGDPYSAERIANRQYQSPYPTTDYFYDFSTQARNLAAYGCTRYSGEETPMARHQHDLRLHCKPVWFTSKPRHFLDKPTNPTTAKPHGVLCANTQYQGRLNGSILRHRQQLYATWCADIGNFLCLDSVTDQPWCFGIVHNSIGVMKH